VSRPALVVAGLVIALLGAPRTARAEDEDIEVQRMRFIERGATLYVTGASIAKLFDQAAYEALDSGFTSTLAVRMWIYPRNGTTPVAAVGLERQVLYNLWDEVYDLRFKEATGTRTHRDKRKSEAFKRLTRLDDVAIARLADVPYDQVYLLAIEVQLNPVSTETLTQVRRWLSQGTGGGLDRGGAFFGSFVSVFVNPKIAEADRVIRIRSQPFYRPRL